MSAGTPAEWAALAETAKGDMRNGISPETVAALVRDGMSPAGATVVDEWVDPGYGVEVAWSLGDLVGVQIPGDALVLWALAPERDEWARAEWDAAGDYGVREEWMRGARFGEWSDFPEEEDRSAALVLLDGATPLGARLVAVCDGDAASEGAALIAAALSAVAR